MVPIGIPITTHQALFHEFMPNILGSAWQGGQERGGRDRLGLVLSREWGFRV